MRKTIKKIKEALSDRRKRLELWTGIFLLVLLSCGFFLKVFEPIELLSLDWRFQLRGEKGISQDLIVVHVDEISLDVYGRWPWTRDKHAGLLQALNYAHSKPAVVGYDMVFEYPDEFRPQADEALAYQAEQFKQDLVMGYFFEWGPVYRFEKNPDKEARLEEFALSISGEQFPRIPEADKVSLPYLDLAHASSLAFVNTPADPDPDGRTRRMPLLLRYQGRIYPSFALVNVLRYLKAEIRDLQVEDGKIKIYKNNQLIRSIPVTPQGDFFIHYYGRASLIPQYSFITILNWYKHWHEGGEIPQGLKEFKDKIILVGASALGLEDRKVTPK